MRVWKIGILAIVLVILVVGLALFLRRVPPEIVLADGTRFKLVEMTSGKRHLWFFSSMAWPDAKNRLAKGYLPWDSFPTLYPNGDIGLIFRRYPKDGALSDAWNGRGDLQILDEQGGARKAHRRMVNFQPERVGNTYAVTAENIYYQIPLTQAKELQFQVVETNQQTSVVTTNRFRVRNSIW